MEIWQELSNFQITSQRLADQVRTIMKKGWFSELGITEIHEKINDQERRNTLPDTSNINKEKQPIQNEPTSDNGNPHPTKHCITKQPRPNTRTKINSKKFKENFKQWKDHRTIIKKHWLENSQGRDQ